MNMAKLNDWLQLAASVGVLIGLLLLVQEIRQANQIANATALAEVYKGWELLSMSETDSDIKAIFARTFESSHDLTSDEVLRLDSWLTGVMMLYMRQASMYYQFEYTIDPADTDWSDLEYYFDSPFTRAWYKINRAWVTAEPELVRIIDELIETTPLRQRLEVLEVMEAEFSAPLAPAAIGKETEKK
jgi:hypothetical protein